MARRRVKREVIGADVLLSLALDYHDKKSEKISYQGVNERQQTGIFTSLITGNVLQVGYAQMRKELDPERESISVSIIKKGSMSLLKEVKPVRKKVAQKDTSERAAHVKEAAETLITFSLKQIQEYVQKTFNATIPYMQVRYELIKKQKNRVKKAEEKGKYVWN